MDFSKSVIARLDWTADEVHDVSSLSFKFNAPLGSVFLLIEPPFFDPSSPGEFVEVCTFSFVASELFFSRLGDVQA
jgi:hypothetical protein